MMKNFILFLLTFIGAFSFNLSTTVAQFSVSGTVTAMDTEFSNARVTLFNNDLSVFFETRTNPDGFYIFNNVPDGNFTVGATFLNKAYSTISLNVLENQEQINFDLAAEAHLGKWEIIMDSPEPLGGTDLGILLPNGKIFYCHNSKDPFLFDPMMNDTSLIPGDSLIQGCVAPALMPNGDLIFAGGADQEVYGPGTKLVKTFNPITGDWENRAEMLDYRWYPTMTQLSDCKYLITGGGGLDNPIRVKTSEVYDPENFTSQSVDDIAIGNEVSPIVLLYSGDALMTHRPPQLYNPTTEQWDLAVDFVQGDRMPNGDHSDHELVLLPNGKVVAVGYKSFTPDYESFIEIYDPATDEWSLGQNFAPNRSRAKTVLLPNKQILVMGGEKEDPDHPAHTNQWNYMKLTDLYHPESDSWRRLDNLNIAREYHCTTILVPDGRVIAVGGEGSPGNEPNLSVIEAFKPPYLFKGVRPEIHNLNQEAFLRGENIEFEIEKTNTPTSVILVSLQAVTHFMNSGNNRFLELDFIQTGNNINAIVPTDSLVAMPGFYMLFAMVDDIPSIAKIVKIKKGQLTTGTNNKESLNSIIIYPNPTANIVRLNGFTKSAVLEIFNTAGQLIKRKTAVTQEVEFNLSKYPVGTYYLRVTTPSGNRIYKFIKI